MLKKSNHIQKNIYMEKEIAGDVEITKKTVMDCENL